MSFPCVISSNLMMMEGWLTIAITFHPSTNSVRLSYSNVKLSMSNASKISNMTKIKVQIVSNQASSFNSNFERQYAIIIRMVSFESDKNEGSQIKSEKKDAQQNFCSKCSQLSSSMDLPNANKQKQMFCE